MEPQPKIICDEASFSVFQSLLQSSGLPLYGLDYKNHILIGYYEGDEMVGTGGIEIYRPYALLRSLSVKLGTRGKSLGSRITEDIIAHAREQKLEAVYLLTETAQSFFRKKGFRVIAREQAPEQIKSSPEFAHACPTSAAVMMLPLL